MVFSVSVNPRASRNRIEDRSGVLKVHLTAPACDGRANEQLIALLSEFLKVKKYNIRIKSGAKSRKKLIEVDNVL